MSIVNEPMTLVHFIDWAVVFLMCIAPFLVSLVRGLRFSLVFLGHLFSAPF